MSNIVTVIKQIMGRPDSNTEITITDFNDFYWRKQELIDVCTTVRIGSSRGKLENADRIRQYILKEKGVKLETKKIKSKSRFNWDCEILTNETKITNNYKNGKNVRRFFIQEIGDIFLSI